MFFGTRSLWAPASSLHGRSRTGPWTGPPDRPPDGPEWTGIGGANFCVVFVGGGGDKFFSGGQKWEVKKIS